MSLKIKICGMRNPANVKEILALSPDLLGFIFYAGSPRNVAEELRENVLMELIDFPSKVAVFVNEELAKVLTILKKYNFGYVQLHGTESVIYCEAIAKEGIKIIKVFSIDEHTDFEQLNAYTSVADYFLFDTKSPAHGGTGHKFDWSLLQKYQLNTPVFLSGGIGPSDIETLKSILISYPFIVGLDLNSRFETSPAQKDAALLETFLEQLRA